MYCTTLSQNQPCSSQSILDKNKQAEDVYRGLLEIYPDDFIVSFQLLRLLKDSGQYDQALTIARRLENKYSSNTSVYFELVEIYRVLEKNIMEMLAQADYHRLNGATDLAKKLYQQILDSPEISLSTESKVREKLAQLLR